MLNNRLGFLFSGRPAQLPLQLFIMDASAASFLVLLGHVVSKRFLGILQDLAAAAGSLSEPARELHY